MLKSAEGWRSRQPELSIIPQPSQKVNRQNVQKFSTFFSRNCTSLQKIFLYSCTKKIVKSCKSLCILPLAFFEKIVYNIYIRLRETKKIWSGRFSKVPQKPTKKFVQDYYLTNSKKYDIIYIERKEKGKVQRDNIKHLAQFTFL